MIQRRTGGPRVVSPCIRRCCFSDWSRGWRMPALAGVPSPDGQRKIVGFIGCGVPGPSGSRPGGSSPGPAWHAPIKLLGFQKQSTRQTRSWSYSFSQHSRNRRCSRQDQAITQQWTRTVAQAELVGTVHGRQYPYTAYYYLLSDQRVPTLVFAVSS